MSKRQTKSVPSKGPSDALKQCVTLCNGVAIPKLGLGTHLMDPDECERAVKAALKQGYRLIDTAAMYSNERGVGKAIRDSNVPRHEVFVSTKLQPCDMGYEGTLAAFHRSLAMLELDYLDLYLIHWPNEDVGRRLGSWKAMEELYAQVSSIYAQRASVGGGGLQHTSITPLIELQKMFCIQAESTMWFGVHGGVQCTVCMWIPPKKRIILMVLSCASCVPTITMTC